MDVRRPVERNDDIVDPSRNLFSVSLEQQPGAEKSYPDVSRSQHIGKPEEIGVHQRFPTRENNPFDI
jgi:hypothetical protein